MRRRQDYRRGNLRRNDPDNYGYYSPDRYQNNGANYYNYVPRSHHRWLMGIFIIILCLGIGWFAADHWLNDNNVPQNTVKRTTINKNTSDQASPNQKSNYVQRPDVGKLEREMNRLNVSEKDQATAVNFYEKQSLRNQIKMDKMIGMINKMVPSDALKRRTLHWILS